jgi:hypothetical protein
MIKMNIALNDQALYEILARLSPWGNDFSMTKIAAEKAANHILEQWRAFALGGDLDGVERLKKPNRWYFSSIKTRPLGHLSYEIYSEAPIADWIENGTRSFDMKKTHTIGPKSRISKKTGVPYLIVPFQWGTPRTVKFGNVMPQSVYNIVKKFEKMRTLRSADDALEKDKTPNNQTPSRMVGRAKYNKGYDRLSGMDFAGTVEEKLKLASSNMAGMVRAEDSTGKNRASGYFTFRVISAASRPGSWINPGIKARHVTEAVVKKTKEPVSEIINEALRVDLKL